MFTEVTRSPVEQGETAVPPLVLTIALAPGDEFAPLRVLSLLARRRCRVRRAAFALCDDGGGPSLRVEVEPPPGRETTVVRWVSALHPVRRVDCEPS